MIKVYLAPGDDCPYMDSFDSRFINTNTHDEADVICLTGGGDIHPALYGEHINGAVATNSVRDLRDLYLINKYSGIKPIVGICRGFQLLAVLDGFNLNQHDPDHEELTSHLITFGNVVPSCHHQTITREIDLHGGDYNMYKTIEEGSNTIESIYCNTKGYFGVQWHPYQCSTETWGYTYFNNSVEELLMHFE